jgi:hypothetical protein
MSIYVYTNTKTLMEVFALSVLMAAQYFKIYHNKCLVTYCGLHSQTQIKLINKNKIWPCNTQFQNC